MYFITTIIAALQPAAVGLFLRAALQLVRPVSGNDCVITKLNTFRLPRSLQIPITALVDQVSCSTSTSDYPRVLAVIP